MRTHQNTTNTIEQLKRCLCERTKSKSRGARWLARNEQILWIRKRSQKLKNKNKRSTWIESNECERDNSRRAHEKWFNTMQYIEHSYTRRPICFDVCACVCNHRQTLRHQLHNGIENVVVVCVCAFFSSPSCLSLLQQSKTEAMSSLAPFKSCLFAHSKFYLVLCAVCFFVVFFFQNTRTDPSRYIAPLFVSVRSTHKHSERKKKNIHYLKWMRYLFDLISPSWCMKCTEKESTNIFQLFNFSMTFSRFLHFIFGFNELYNTITHRMYVDVNFDVIFIKHLNFAYRREQTKPFDKQMNNK